jgi:hypothetical protein
MANWASSPIIVPSTGAVIQIGWATVPPRNDEELAKALGQAPLLTTFNLPKSRADDLESWGVPPDGEPGTIGHRILVGAWDGRERAARSWGEDTRSPSIHPDFWASYCVAVDVPVLMIKSEEFGFDSMDYEAMEEAMARLVLAG